MWLSDLWSDRNISPVTLPWRISVWECRSRRVGASGHRDLLQEIKTTMRNRAEKDAVRWCHSTHQFIAEGISSSRGRGESTSVHSREPKATVAEVYPYFILALKVILLDQLHTFNWWRPLRSVYAYSVNIGPRPANRPSAQTYTQQNARISFKTFILVWPTN